MLAGLHLAIPHPASAEVWLRADGLVCERAGRALFEGLDLTLASGEILQVEGANGSGKTSLLRILAGLLEPDAGVVRWRGDDIRAQRNAYHAQLAYIGHRDGLKAELTPRENLAVAVALSGRAPGLSCDAALEVLGMDAYADDPIASLSAGQRRRIALARLLMIPAALWLLDEPFTALDKTALARVESLLRAHVEAGGMAVVSTHHGLRLSCRRLRLTGAAA